MCFTTAIQGGYFEHYKVFFTKYTYLTGQDGGFTPGHLWFMLYLFVISMIMLPFMNKYSKSSKKIDGSKIGMVHLFPILMVILISTPILDIGGKSLGEALACFAIGFFVLSDELVQERLEKNSFLLMILFLFALIVRIILQYNELGSGLIWDIEQRMVTWLGIMAILGIGKKYLNKSNAVTRYLSKAAFPLYYFHQSVLVVLGYYVLKYTNLIWIQFPVIMIGSFLITIMCYEVFRRFKISAFLFGIKYIK